MKITLCSDFLTAPLTGVGRYAFELARRLATDSRIESFDLVSFRGVEHWAELESRLRDAAHRPSDESRTAFNLGALRGLAQRVAERAVNHPVGSWLFESLQQKHYVKTLVRGQTELIHAPGIQRIPEFENAGAARVASVVTVHDLSHRISPEWHPAQRVARIERAMKMVCRADKIIAVSQATAAALTEFYPATRDRIVVIPNGVNVANPEKKNEGRSEAAPVPGHTLCVSTIEPRKNIDSLLAAYASLPAAVRRAFPLVLIGAAGWHSRDTHQLIERYAAEGWLDYRGYVDAERLATCYANAKLVVYPSLHEGFGLPVLEALAYGCDVIAGNHSSIPEVAGGHARLLDDVCDIDEMREAILGALGAPTNAAAAAERRAFAAFFSWDRSAEQTVKTYAAVIAGV